MAQALRDNMQAQTRERATTWDMPVLLEWAVIGVLALFSLLWHVAGVGMPTMTPGEVPPALNALRSVTDDAPGASVMPDSAALFWSQRIGFGVLGSSVLAARLGTALAGVLLSLSPLLFRDLFGRWRTLFLVVVLVVSPTLMGASRFSSPAVWTVLFAVVGLWGVWRYVLQRSAGHAIMVLVAFGAMTFLGGPGGPMLLLILAAAAVIAVLLTSLDVSADDAEPGSVYLWKVADWLHGWPWGMGLLGAVLVTFAAATGFLLYPAGLSTVGGTLAGFISGWTNAAYGSPLTTVLLYDTWLVLLGIVAIVVLRVRGEMTVVERFLAGWVLTGTVASLVYPGAGVADGLWLLLPLAALSAYLAAASLEAARLPSWWLEELLSDKERQARLAAQGKWLLTALAFILLIMAAMHFQIASRGFWTAEGGSLLDYLSLLSTEAFAPIVQSLIWFLISTLFIVVGYFLASSVWGAVIPAQALVLGLTAYVIVSSLGTGWALSASRVNDPSEYWFANGASEQVALLQETLDDLSMRETGGFPALPVVAKVPDDGLIAWALRDYHNARFITTMAEAQGEPVIILSGDDVPPPDATEDMPALGGSYVGQDFDIRLTFNLNSLTGLKVLPYWAQRLDNAASYDTIPPVETVPERIVTERAVLWVRQDVYDSTSPDLLEE